MTFLFASENLLHVSQLPSNSTILQFLEQPHGTSEEQSRLVVLLWQSQLVILTVDRWLESDCHSTLREHRVTKAFPSGILEEEACFNYENSCTWEADHFALLLNLLSLLSCICKHSYCIILEREHQQYCPFFFFTSMKLITRMSIITYITYNLPNSINKAVLW